MFGEAVVRFSTYSAENSPPWSLFFEYPPCRGEFFDSLSHRRYVDWRNAPGTRFEHGGRGAYPHGNSQLYVRFHFCGGHWSNLLHKGRGNITRRLCQVDAGGRGWGFRGFLCTRLSSINCHSVDRGRSLYCVRYPFLAGWHKTRGLRAIPSAYGEDTVHDRGRYRFWLGPHRDGRANDTDALPYGLARGHQAGRRTFPISSDSHRYSRDSR